MMKKKAKAEFKIGLNQRANPPEEKETHIPLDESQLSEESKKRLKKAHEFDAIKQAHGNF